MARVYLLLGSNLGDREQNIGMARRHISRYLGEVITTSSLYKTSPWGNTGQPDYYNQVVVLDSTLAPIHFLDRIQDFENQNGRDRTRKWAPRNIDIDILFWGNEIVNTDQLKIPHPLIGERRFALAPLNEVAPDFVHPVNHKTVRQLLRECTDDLQVEKLELKSTDS